MLDLTVIGDVAIDTYYLLDERDASVICSTRNRVCELCFELNEKIPVREIEITVGGNAANVAVAASRLGFETGIVTTVGNDADGKQILYKLEMEDVDLKQVESSGKTNQTVAMIYEGKRTLLVHHEDRNYNLTSLKPTKWVYLTSLSAQGGKIAQPLLDLIQNYNVKLIFSPGTYQRREGPKAYAELLEMTDVIIMNKEEAEDYTGKNKVSYNELLKALTDLGPTRAIITDDVNGSYGFDGVKYYKCGVCPAKVLESTGAGDAYAGGFSAAIMQGKTFEEAMSWGSANAASVIEHVGPQRGLLSIDKITKRCNRCKITTSL